MFERWIINDHSVPFFRKQTIHRRAAINYVLQNQKRKPTVGYHDAVYFDPWLQLYYVCINNYPESKLNHNLQKFMANKKLLQSKINGKKLKKKHYSSTRKQVKLANDNYLMDICKTD